MPAFFTRATKIVTLFFFSGVFFVAHADTASVKSKRIEVYSLSQNYWDTQYGDTLGNIVLQLLPNNPAKHENLKLDIVELNPEAFIGGSRDKLLAGKRLRLPGYMKQADSTIDPATTTVEQYSWGNIKRPRE
jgi:Tfp pilus assembly protein FimV